ncbi:MAG TPA: ABC transporter ATP-binding protein [Mycobacteriales bacterium]|nr:ABC transporter ATP-binding protein [Mycobacteriales bacterium]
MSALELSGLGFRHPGATDWALRGVSLQVQPGEVLAVVGPSGSGKTTLLRLVSGLLDPSEGSVLLGGSDVATVPPERRPVAMVFQGFALFPHLTVRDNIAFGLAVRRMAKPERRMRAEQAAADLRIAPLLDRLPSELSGGERQRVALARALVREPSVFCLDEPLSSLDPVLRTEARRLLSTLVRAEGRCGVYVTHDQAEAMTVGDRVAVLHQGRLEQVGSVRELHERPGTAFVAGFLGSPPMSLLPATAGRAGPLRADVPDGTLLGVRAEDVRVDPTGESLAVREVEDHGHEQLVYLDVDGRDLVIRLPTGAPVGTTLRVRVHPATVRCYDPGTGRLL